MTMHRVQSLALVSSLFLASASFAACPAGTQDLSAQYPNGLPNAKLQLRPACQLSGTYTSSMNLSADNVYLISGGVYFGDDVGSTILTVAPGVTFRGKEGRDFLAIRRGSKILAEGTAANPIVFTGFDPAKTTRGQWGGLVLNGRAPINQCKNPGAAVCENDPEGGVLATYGGSNPDDNSGVLKYVRVEYPGFEISPNNELNGITFNGVGRGTVVEHIQVHGSNDDGIEFFGGTADVRYVVITSAQDDGLDWDFGWSGRAQYVLIKQEKDDGNNGIEADNNVNNNAASPRSNPTIANMTIIGGSPKAGDGILLRRGSGAQLYNVAITGFTSSCFNIDDADTFANAQESAGIVMKGVIVSCNTAFGQTAGDLFSIADWFTAAGNRQVNPSLSGYLPSDENSPLYFDAVELSSVSDFFEESGFIGAVENLSSSSADWTQGWTKAASL